MRGAARSAAAALVLLSWICAAAQVSDPTADMKWDEELLVVVKSARLTDNGDNDGFADPHETVNVFLTLRNASDKALSGIVVALVTEDPHVDCVLTPVVAFGSLGAKETREATVPLTFRVASVARATPDEELTAVFDVLIWGDQFDASIRTCDWPPGPCRQTPQQVTFDLDLDVSGGLLPTSFTEGFEGGGFGTFTTMTLDVGKASNALSDGHRCQYNDPDFAGSNSYGNMFCYLGFTAPANNAFDWHVHGLASPDGGRAYLGNNSLHWGVHPGSASVDTTRLAQLDAIRSNLPVNLGWNGVVPELSFKHQVGLVDYDYVGSFGQTVDRGVVQVQLANSTGQATGDWRKISPYENLYDSQTTDSYRECLFDPTDDGSDEDDYFDPSDPDRRLGPSSTCYPEFAFSRLGAIFFSETFDPADIAHASDGPGLQGSRGPGTWVESKFSLDRYRGRRLRIRFLATSITVAQFAETVTMQQALGVNPSPADDGWYIDDIRVTNTLTGAATVRVDTSDRSALPSCPAACSSLSASLVADPNPSSRPGEPIVLDASASVADTCPGGPLLYRFWHDQNGDGVLTDSDRVLHSWTDHSVLVDKPNYTRSYAVEVRCSSQVSCADRADVLVTVPCVAPLFSTLRFHASWYLTWDVPARVDVVSGDLGALRASGGDFRGTVIGCEANSPYGGTTVSDEPAPGNGFYYLAREAGPTYVCGPSWGTGSPAELPGAGGDRDADLAADPWCP